MGLQSSSHLLQVINVEDDDDDDDDAVFRDRRAACSYLRMLLFVDVPGFALPTICPLVCPAPLFNFSNSNMDDDLNRGCDLYDLAPGIRNLPSQY